MRLARALATLFALGIFAVAPIAPAADLSDVGFVDQVAIASLPEFISANKALNDYKSSLDRDFASAVKRAHSQSDQQRIAAQFQAKLVDRQRQVVGPLFERAQTAIASVSSSKNLSVVVDKRIVIFGGQDITKAVIDLMRQPGPVVPPVSTPPPSEIGFVDQNALNTIPKLKDANDQFTRFDEQQKQAARQKMAGAKTDADRKAVLADYQKAMTDKEDTLLKPLVDQTKSVIADVAKKKNLILVIDKGDLVYGGTDITSDVQNALK